MHEYNILIILLITCCETENVKIRFPASTSDDIIVITSLKILTIRQNVNNNEQLQDIRLHFRSSEITSILINS